MDKSNKLYSCAHYITDGAGEYCKLVRCEFDKDYPHENLRVMCLGSLDYCIYGRNFPQKAIIHNLEDLQTRLDQALELVEEAYIEGKRRASVTGNTLGFAIFKDSNVYKKLDKLREG